MPVSDLSGISGLDGKQRAVLSQKLGITSCYELIMADRQRIIEAFGRRTIRPELEDVAAWQDEARLLHVSSRDASVSAIASPGWEQVAAFVVAFEERRRGDAAERRAVAEHAEIEPEASRQQRCERAGWECGDACRWMRERIGVQDAPASPGPAQITPAGEPPAAEAPATEAHAKVYIEHAKLTDSGGDVALAAESRPLLPQDRLVWAQPARLVVTLGGTPPGARASVILQLVQAGGRKCNIAGHLDHVGRVAEIELSGLGDGDYTPA